MINVNMTSTEGVTLATSGKYCEDNIKITPTCIPNYRKFTGEIVSTVTGDSSKALLLTDPIIAEHYTDETLAITVTFDDYCTYEVATQNYTPYTLVQTLGANSQRAYAKKYANPVDIRQHGIRNGSSAVGVKLFTTPLYNTTSGVGALQVDSQGNLYVIVDSTNYAVRPSKYTVEMSWGD